MRTFWKIACAGMLFLWSSGTAYADQLLPGIYINGDVKKHYSIGAFIEREDQAVRDVNQAGLDAVSYVSPHYRGATFWEIVEEGLEEAIRDLTYDDFRAQTYEIITPTGETGGYITIPDGDPLLTSK